MARDLDQLGANFSRGDQRGAAGNHQRTAGESAPAVRRAVGIAVHDLDHLGRDADLVGDDLGERRAQPLAVRRGADARLDEAGRIDGNDDCFPAGRDLHAARRECRAAVAGAFGKRRKANAEMAAFGARLFLALAESGHVDRFHRHFQRLFVAGIVVFEAHGGLVGKLVDQIAPADIDRIDGKGARGLVHQPLERECDHRPRHAAIGRHGAGIGDDAAREALILLNVVGARHFGHRHQRLDPAGGRKAGIGADIGDNVGLQREQLGVLVERAFERDVLIARMKAGDQILAPIFGPGHRAFEFARQPDQHDVFAGERHLLPEAAADVGRDHAQVGFRETEHVADCRARQMRHLRGAGEGDTPGRRDHKRRGRRAPPSAWRSGGASAPRP